MVPPEAGKAVPEVGTYDRVNLAGRAAAEAVGAAEQTEAKAAARMVKVVDFIFGLFKWRVGWVMVKCDMVGWTEGWVCCLLNKNSISPFAGDRGNVILSMVEYSARI